MQVRLYMCNITSHVGVPTIGNVKTRIIRVTRNNSWSDDFPHFAPNVYHRETAQVVSPPPSLSLCAYMSCLMSLHCLLIYMRVWLAQSRTPLSNNDASWFWIQWWIAFTHTRRHNINYWSYYLSFTFAFWNAYIFPPNVYHCKTILWNVSLPPSLSCHRVYMSCLMLATSLHCLLFIWGCG